MDWSSLREEETLRPGTIGVGGGEVVVEGGLEPPMRTAMSRAMDWLSGLISMVAPSVFLRARYRGEISGRYIEWGVAVLDMLNSNSGSSSFRRWGGLGDTNSSRH